MSRVVNVNPDCPDPDVVKEAVKVLRNGGIIVIPTDTVYGLAADPFNEDAVKRVYEVKERSQSKPLPLLLGEAHHALRLVKPNQLFWSLAMRYWPGPLTLVAESREDLPGYLRRWEGIGVRLPNCNLCRSIARKIGGAIIGTSANISGMEAPRTAAQAMSMLGDQVDLYLDGGPTFLGVSSTVVDTRGESPRIIREGYIRKEALVAP
ncbi:MAG: threonylcarbamoyl-AMP synthase [Desulfurococcales archaeon]|nr:threonylcarbamoyl-AMP synthase [Desulfurococcales archaeon]MCE4605347.1 threonylcarbamoyl-AMP synthase [Desulfurococcales archaeon]